MQISKYNVQMTATSMDFKLQRTSKISIQASQLPNLKHQTSAVGSTTGTPEDLKLTTIKNLLEYIFGIKINEYSSEQQTNSDNSNPAPEQTSIELSSSESLRLQNETFNADASITTTDGRTIQLHINEDTTKLEYGTILSTGPVNDPLILNLNGSALSITNDKSSNIPTLKNGVYVGYDSNGNGLIDGQSELLGFKSGNAFNDLKSLDLDKNNWLDSGDSNWNKLMYWNNNQSGSLSSLGVGALFTNSTTTHFEDENFIQTGKSIFLMADGTAKTSTQVDIKT